MTSRDLNNTGICDTTNINGKIGIRRKKRHKVTSTHNSTLCRNTTLNSTMLKQTLKSNNRALAKRLEMIRFDLAETQKLVLKEKEEKQNLHQKYTTLYKLVGLRDDELEAEVERRMQLRLTKIKENLNSILGNVMSTVDLLQNGMTLCEPRLSRGSSLGLGCWGNDSESPPEQPVTGAKRSIYYQGPNVQPVPLYSAQSQEPMAVQGVESSVAATLTAALTELPEDLLHQGLDVILEQSGLSESMILSEEPGSRRNSKRSRPNSTTGSGSRRNSRRSAQYQANVNRTSGEANLQETTRKSDQDQNTLCPALTADTSPTETPADERPILSKFAPHIQGTTPAQSPSQGTPVNKDEEEFYSRFVPLEEDNKISSKKGTPKTGKSANLTALSRKTKKNEDQTSRRGAEDSANGEASKETSISPVLTSQTLPQAEEKTEEASLSKEVCTAVTKSKDKAKHAALNSKIQKKQSQKEKNVSQARREQMHTQKTSEEICTEKMLEIPKSDQASKSADKRETFVLAKAPITSDSEKEGNPSSMTNKRGTFVLRKPPIEEHSEIDQELDSSSGKKKTAENAKKESSAVGKRGTFVLENPPLVSAEKSDSDDDRVKRKTVKSARRAAVSKGSKDKPDRVKATSSDSKENQRLRRGTFCIPSSSKAPQGEVASDTDGAGILGEKDSILMDTSVLSQAPVMDEAGMESEDITSQHDDATDETDTKDDHAETDDEQQVCLNPASFGGNSVTVHQINDVFKVPFPVSSAFSQSSETDHTICEPEEMEMTEVLPTEKIDIPFEDKVPVPSFITRENSTEPAFLKDVSLEVKEQENEVCEEGKEERKKVRSKRRESIRLKDNKKGSRKSEKRVKSVQDVEDDILAADDLEVPTKKTRHDSERKSKKSQQHGESDSEKNSHGKKLCEIDSKKSSHDCESDSKKNCHDSESDSSEGGRVRKHFSTFVSKPGKIMFKSGRKDMSEIISASKSGNNFKSKSMLPKAKLKTTASKLKAKLLPSTSPLNTSRIGLAKNVFDLSLNESIPVPSSISYGQFLEQKTIKDQSKLPSQTSSGKKNMGATVNETETEHGIMLVLANGKRTKPRRPRTKSVHYAQELTEDHLITPAGDAKVESRTGEAENKSTAAKKKAVEVKKTAGHTPPRKPLDSKQRKKLAEAITKHNEAKTGSSSCGEEDSPKPPEKSRRQSRIKVNKMRIVSDYLSEQEDDEEKECESTSHVKGLVNEKDPPITAQFNSSLFSADHSDSDDQRPSPQSRLTSPKTSMPDVRVSLERLNVRPDSVDRGRSRDTLKDNHESPRLQGRKSRKDSGMETRVKHGKNRLDSDSPPPVNATYKKQSQRRSLSNRRGHRSKRCVEMGDEREEPQIVSEKKYTRKPYQKKNVVVSDSSDSEMVASERRSSKKNQHKSRSKSECQNVVAESDEEEMCRSGRSSRVGGQRGREDDRSSVRQSLDYGEEESEGSEEEKEQERTNVQTRSVRKTTERTVRESVVESDTDDDDYQPHPRKGGGKRKKSPLGVEKKQKISKKASSSRVAESELDDLPPVMKEKVKRKKNVKEKKQLKAEVIQLPVDTENIKEEVVSFIAESDQESEFHRPQEESPCVGRRSRRAGSGVSYKEPSLTSKMRRGDTHAQSVYSGKDAPTIFKEKKDAKRSSGKRPSMVDKKRIALVTIGNTLEEA